MIKLCYKIHDKKTDEYYFDLQSQKVYQICLSAYYAKQNTKGILFLLISGGVAATFLEEVSKQIILSENVRILSMILVIGILVLIDQKVKNHLQKSIDISRNIRWGSKWKDQICSIYIFGGDGTEEY